MSELQHRVAVTQEKQFISELREVAGDDPEKNTLVDSLESIQKDWEAVERIMLDIGFKAFLHQAITVGRKHGLVP